MSAAPRGRLGLRAVRVVDAAGQGRDVAADLLAMAGGWSPAVGLACHMGHRPHWDQDAQGFVPEQAPPGMEPAGAAAGQMALAAALLDGAAKGAAAAGSCGHSGNAGPAPRTDQQADAPSPVWLMPRTGKAFVDFQHDVTAADVALAHREGFRSVEHLKRYTTLGMATDQGKLANVNGLALMAELTGRSIAETGTTMFRPPYAPVAIGALAGHHRGPRLPPHPVDPRA